MQPRTRAVLAALNIPVWMGRGGSVQRARVSVWRDTQQTDPVAESALPLSQVVDSAAPSARFIPNADTLRMATSATSSTPQAVDAKRVQAREAFAPTLDPVAESLAVPVEVHAAVEPLLRFSIQARLIGDWIVLVPEQALQDAACQRLWDNIAQAMQASAPESFIWPLAEGARWQRMDGASAAVAGFLYRLGKTQRVGLMGELPDQVCPDRIERLPSLPDLLANPLQKRSLWLLLRPNIA